MRINFKWFVLLLGTEYVVNPQASFLCALLDVPDLIRAKFDAAASTTDATKQALNLAQQQLSQLRVVLHNLRSLPRVAEQHSSGALPALPGGVSQIANPEEIPLDDLEEPNAEPSDVDSDDDGLNRTASSSMAGHVANPEELDISDALNDEAATTSQTATSQGGSAAPNPDEINLDDI